MGARHQDSAAETASLPGDQGSGKAKAGGKSGSGKSGGTKSSGGRFSGKQKGR
ncbi:hypothetical protein [Rhodococcus erythropolis]|uniref:hypothetical protein n=1 Tax=Rhodococcus erythropolis TaxID=1833 RepID=UPI0024B816B0|nr:hypothetical protein [Rhodococcus erythropolis]MDJ0012676.1 hypothetical protein [Rhodococcus erythropolis]